MEDPGGLQSMGSQRVRHNWATSLCLLVWNQGAWCFQLCSSFSSLLWLFGIFCGSNQIRELLALLICMWKILWNLIELELNVQIILDSADILTILSLPIHNQSTSFHLFLSSWICFINVLYLSAYRCLISLVKFILSHFILSDAIINSIF